jgi:hypothetical protein
MPALAPDQLECAIYFYNSEEDAQNGVRYGACGFLVSYPGPAGLRHLYAVTNKHVVDGIYGKSHVLRINTRDGFGTLQTRREEWEFADHDDLAVIPLELGDEYQISAIRVESFLGPTKHTQPKNQFDPAAFQFSPGDEVVMIGRMVNHAGRQKNRPIVRFGNIAMMPDEDDPVELPIGPQVAFLVDCRSLPGTSGSAVLGYLHPERPGGMRACYRRHWWRCVARCRLCSPAEMG